MEPRPRQQRHPPQHRKRDVHGPGAAQPREDELLAADARVLERGQGGLQAGAAHRLQGRAVNGAVVLS